MRIMLTLIIMSLATYRVARFLILDSLIATPRIWLHQVLLGKQSKVRRYLYELINCPYCMSIWIAAAIVALADRYTSVPMPIFTWLAVSAGSLVTWNYIED